MDQPFWPEGGRDAGDLAEAGLNPCSDGSAVLAYTPQGRIEMHITSQSLF